MDPDMPFATYPDCIAEIYIYVMAKITIQNTVVNIIKIDGFICLTDMLRAKDGDFFITD